MIAWGIDVMISIIKRERLEAACRCLSAVLLVVGLSQQAFAVDNHLPEIKSVSFADPYVHRGVDLVAVPYVVDEDGDPVSLKYRWFLNGRELTENDQPELAGGLFVKGDKIALWIVPSDDYGVGKTYYGAEFIVPNAPPQIEMTSSPILEGDVFRYRVRASDADEDLLHFSLQNAPPGMSIDETTGEIAWAGYSEQTVAGEVLVIVEDTEGARAQLPIQIGATSEN